MIVDTLWLLAELAVLFFGVTFLVQLFQRRMGPDRIRSFMGGVPIVAALKGIAIGFMTPFCTFTAIPMLVGLRQAGVPPAGYVAFIVAAPVLDPVLLGALVIIVGVEAAGLYLAVAFTAALGLALIAQRVGMDGHLKAMGDDGLVGVGGQPATMLDGMDDRPASAVGAGAPGSRAGAAWRGLGREARPAAGAAVALLRNMAPLLLVGVGLALVIEASVPPDLTERLTSARPDLAIPIAAALGTPLYVSTGVFVPIADSLQAAGVGIGAIVALTIAGAGANIPEFVILSKLAKPRTIAVFCGYVFAVAVVGGLLAEALVAGPTAATMP